MRLDRPEHKLKLINYLTRTLLLLPLASLANFKKLGKKVPKSKRSTTLLFGKHVETWDCLIRTINGLTRDCSGDMSSRLRGGESVGRRSKISSWPVSTGNDVATLLINQNVLLGPCGHTLLCSNCWRDQQKKTARALLWARQGVVGQPRHLYILPGLCAWEQPRMCARDRLGCAPVCVCVNLRLLTCGRPGLCPWGWAGHCVHLVGHNGSVTGPSCVVNQLLKWSTVSTLSRSLIR